MTAAPQRPSHVALASGPAFLGRLKTRQLQLLETLDEARSLRKAAAALNMTQPAATKLLQDLEASLGLQLFERRSRGVIPTAYGEVMIRHARFMLADLDHAREELAALASGAAGRVAIGGVISAVPFLIARAVAALKRRQPRLVVSIEVGTSDVLAPALARGDLDVLVARPLAAEGRADFAYEPLVDEPLVVVARPGHPALSQPTPALGSLGAWTWCLLPSPSPMRRVLAPVMAEIGPPPPWGVVETSSMMTMAALLQESDMLAVMPDDVARYHVSRGLLARVAVDLPPVMGAYGLVTRRDRPLSSAAAAFVASLREALAEREEGYESPTAGP